jgi:hypothetical protein
MNKSNCRECEEIAKDFQEALQDSWQSANQEARDSWLAASKLMMEADDGFVSLEPNPRASPRVVKAFRRNVQHMISTGHDARLESHK